MRRILGYCCAAILLLSLPTFSDWVPRVQFDPYPIQTQGSAVSVSRQTAGSTAAVSTAPSRAGRPLVSAPGFVSARRSEPAEGGEIVVSPVRSAAPAPVAEAIATAEGGGSSAAPSPQARGGAPLAVSERTALMDELSLMEREFQSIHSNMFTGGGGGVVGNPFQEALDDKRDRTGLDGDSGPGDGPGSDSGEGDGGSPDSGGSSPPPSPPAPPVDDGSPGVAYSFLLVGFEDQSAPRPARRLLHRAHRSASGTFVLENGVRWDLLPGLVAPGREMLIADQTDQITTLASPDRSRLRYLSARLTSLGTVLEERAGASASWPVETLVVFYQKVLRSLAAFDLDGSGSEEMIATFHNSPNLVVLRRDDGTLSYQRELAIPFAAAFAVGSRSLLIQNQAYVQVFDAEMRRFVTFSMRHPGAYSFSKPPSHVRREELHIDTSAGERIRYELLVYDTRLALWEESASGLRLLGSFNTELGMPIVLVGDYLQNGRRQLLLVP